MRNNVMIGVGLLAAVGLGLPGCSAKYQTGANGLPVGSPDVTYQGPGAGVGGTQVGKPPPPQLPSSVATRTTP